MTRFLSVFITLILIPIFSQGYLGEQTGLRAQMRVQDSPSVVQMDEMTDTQGIVRQVRWSGPYHPDFKSVLGDCYEKLNTELRYQARARGMSVLKVSNQNCFLQIGGSLGHVYGEAHTK